MVFKAETVDSMHPKAHLGSDSTIIPVHLKAVLMWATIIPYWK